MGKALTILLLTSLTWLNLTTCRFPHSPVKEVDESRRTINFFAQDNFYSSKYAYPSSGSDSAANSPNLDVSLDLALRLSVYGHEPAPHSANFPNNHVSLELGLGLSAHGHEPGSRSNEFDQTNHHAYHEPQSQYYPQALSNSYYQTQPQHDTQVTPNIYHQYESNPHEYRDFYNGLSHRDDQGEASSVTSTNKNLQHASSSGSGAREKTVFDLSESKIAQGYSTIASLKFPLRGHDPRRYISQSGSSEFSNEQIMEIIKKSIKESKISFSLMQIEFLTLDRMLNRNLQLEEDKQCLNFIASLSLRNIAFLLFIHFKLDIHIQKELTNTLNWFHDIKSTMMFGSESDFRKALKEQYESHIKNERECDLKYNAGRTYRNSFITDFRKEEARIIIEILGNYYKSGNPEKWQKFFLEDDDFFDYYHNFASGEVSYKDPWTLKNDYWYGLYIEDSLPWSTGEITIIDPLNKKAKLINLNS